MSTLNCTVVPGHVFVPDSQQRVYFTYARLNDLGEPIVTILMDGTIETEDLTADTADMLPIIGFTVDAEVSDKIEVDVQVQNANAVTNSNQFLVRCWLSDTATGAETATTPANDLTVEVGTLLEEVTADEHMLVLTNAAGLITLKVDHTGGTTHTWYLLACVGNGKIYASGKITITV